MATKHKTWRGFQQFGNPDSRSGALYAFTKEGILDLRVEMMAEVLGANGLPVNRETRRALRELAKRQQAELESEVRARGVPAKLRKLFRAPRKRKKQQICKRLVISAQDFEALVMNCEEIGLRHRTMNIEFVPDHLEPTIAEHGAFWGAKQPGKPLEGGAKRFLKKVWAICSQRRCVTVHLFEGDGGGEWHCFYFSHQDIFSNRLDGSNHWRGGPHLHYISNDWAGWTAQRVWEELAQRKASVPSLHIRFEDDPV